MIEIKDLSFSYEEGGKYIIENLNLTINEGEFVAILGHNGSGKSTLAKLINGIISPTVGDILVDGLNTKDQDAIWDIRSKAGMVFQNPDNQLVATIVEDDVAFGPENLGLPTEEIRKRVDEALLTVGMENYKEHAPHLLSGGQKQRVAIAGILAMNPDYIILDEPTAMLDPIGRKEVIETVLNLNKNENKTILLITHYMEEATLADRIIVMDDGKILMEGSPREVFSQVEKIKEVGLDVPQVTEIAYRLANEGFNISPVLTIEELVEEICQY